MSSSFHHVQDDASSSSTLHRPTLKILFKFTGLREGLLYLFPAVAFSIGAGLLSPYVTVLLGIVFNAYTDYSTIIATTPPSSVEQIQSANDDLFSTIIRVSGILFGLAGARLCLNTAGGVFFGLNGESTIRNLRRNVFISISSKPMEWYDLGVYAQTQLQGNSHKHNGSNNASNPESQDLGGLMVRYTREIDDVRVASTTTVTNLLQNISTVIACLIVAFLVSFKLTFVILATIPVIIVITILTEKLTRPLVSRDRDLNLSAASQLQEIFSAISTVKAFNSQEYEKESFFQISKQIQSTYNRLHLILGSRIGIIQTLLLLMFVQGFWFGTYLVDKGEINTGQVAQVFWAALEASSHLEACIPLLGFLEKGKVGMASMLYLIDSKVPEPSKSLSSMTTANTNARLSSGNPKSPLLLSSSPRQKHFKDNKNIIPRLFRKQSFVSSATTTSSTLVAPSIISSPIHSEHLRPLKISPPSFSGELCFKNVTFYYSTRPPPHPPALSQISMYFASCERTFVVGQSGSGKSTIGSLLLGLYTPYSGSIETDEQDISWIDEKWLRAHVYSVAQGESFIFEGSVHDNIAIGIEGKRHLDGVHARSFKDVSRPEVIQAAKFSLSHEFIQNLPDGYDTLLSNSGGNGVALSGGQCQRLALARAWMRNPTVLILDEATSALDPTSRLLINEAIKAWRKNKTTIIITHDLSMITENDYVYLIESGQVAEHGFRQQLENIKGGHFESMAKLQATGSEFNVDASTLSTTPLTKSTSSQQQQQEDNGCQEFGYFPTLPSSPDVHIKKIKKTRKQGYYERMSQATRHTLMLGQQSSHHHSSSFRPISQNLSFWSVDAIENAANTASQRRNTKIKKDNNNNSNSKRNTIERKLAQSVTHDEKHDYHEKEDGEQGAEKVKDKSTKDRKRVKLHQYRDLIKVIYPMIPNKMLFFIGVFFSIGTGILPPAFSFLLARLANGIGTNVSHKQGFLETSLLMIMVGILDGFSHFMSFSVLQRVSMGWVTKLRTEGISKLLIQDYSFFEKSMNATNHLVNILVKDSGDAINLVGLILGQVIAIVTILIVGPIWALAIGWQLTLAGLSLAPIFVIVTWLHLKYTFKLEGQNKVLRENLAREFYETISNIKSIRSISAEHVFIERLEPNLQKAFVEDCKLASLHGLGLGVVMGLIFFAQGILYLAGAKFMIDLDYDMLQVLQVLALMVFSASFASQMVQYMPAFAKSMKAAQDLNSIARLKSETSEGEGKLVFPVKGNINFENVNFSYPKEFESNSRLEQVPVLKNMSFEIKAGECVGIVGPSGSGKSTITSLLQRLYEPTGGKIYIDEFELDRMDVKYLRDGIGIVPQKVKLFNKTVGENIRYGDDDKVGYMDIMNAAKNANAHEFIMKSLPNCYDTKLGTNGSLISGGQAQRLGIARAIVRSTRNIFIFDEATSALDEDNQNDIMNTILDVRKARTTIIVTHKVAMMKMCDRLLVVKDGQIAESGTFSELVQKRGVFAQLLNVGEWV